MRGWGSRSVAVPAAIIVLLLAAATLFLASLRDPGYARFNLADADAEAAATSSAHQVARTFVVDAAPFSLVELRVNGHRVASAYVPWNEHAVRFEDTPLADGHNEIVALTTLWYAAAQDAHAATLELENPPTAGGALKLDDLPPSSGGDVHVHGAGPANTELVLWDSARPTAPKDAPPQPMAIVSRLSTDEGGSFEADIALDEGLHRFWIAPPNCTSASCFTPAKQDTTVVTRSAPPPPPFRNGRSLAFHLRYQEVQTALAVELARTDPAMIALLHGRIDLPAFVDDVFGAPRLNSRPVSSFFTNARPTFYVAEDGVTVAADSGYQRPGLENLPPFAGDVQIADAFTAPRVSMQSTADSVAPPPARDPRVWTQDVLRLSVEDYRIVDAAPVPFRTEGATYVWERPFSERQPPVGVSLAYTPLASIDALRRGMNLSVFAFTYQIVARYLAFGHGFLLAIPMFAYLALSRGKNPRYAKIARGLIVLAVASDVFNACISSQPEVNGKILDIVPALRALTSSVLTNLVVPVVIGLMLWAVAWCIEQLLARSQHRAVEIAREAARAVELAALGYVLVAVVGYVAAAFAHVPVLYPVMVDLMLAVAVVAVLAALDWWTIPEPRNRTAFTLVTVLFALLIAVPFSLVHYGLWASSPAEAATAFADPTAPLPLTSEFLRAIAPMCPFVFGLFLIAGVRPSPLALGLESEQFARIAFCCYAVDISGVVVLLPVSFILAWLSFRLIRGPAPANADSIAKDRAQIIGDVLTRPNMSQLSSKVARLADDLVDGNIDEPTFRDRRRTAMHVFGEADDDRCDDVLAVPPYNSVRRNGLAALPLAFVFAVAQIVLFLSVETRYLRELHTPFVALELTAFVAVAVGSLVVPAFAFGACYEHVAGPSGLRKALTVALWVIACSLPAWFLRLESSGAIVVLAVETAVFYTALGLYFDILIVRRTMGHRFRLSDVARLSGLSAVSWAGGVAIAALGVALNGVLSGQFQNGLTQVVTSFVHQASPGP